MAKQLNSNLHSAKRAKNDEFYTQLSDIEKELRHYKDHFKDKHVFCNCDDPTWSNFYRYFNLNFEFLGLKQLTTTHYNPDGSTYRIDVYPGAKKEVVDDIEMYEGIITPLQGNGDFRSDEAVEILKECDIVVTNPPFSLMRSYIEQLMVNTKKFLVLGNANAVAYKDMFKYLKNNEMWLGVNNGGMVFEVPLEKEYQKSLSYFEEGGKGYRKFGNITWYTNLVHEKRYDDIILFKKYTPDDYEHFDNYNAINVNRVKDIPMDYEGVMGVPLTFLNKYNPEQFEILGITSGREEFDEAAHPVKRYINAKQINRQGVVTNGSKVNTGAMIYVSEIPEATYYIADNVDGYLRRVYTRILIRNKQLKEMARGAVT